MMLFISLSSVTGNPAEQNQQKADAFATFLAKVKEYSELHRRLEKKIPKLSRKSEAEEIAAHREALAEMIQTARANAKPGDIFGQDAATRIRQIIRDGFKGIERQDLRGAIMDENTKGVPLRVNYPYPEAKALSLVPPTLLLKLPQLPQQLEYRFVGRHLVLLDEKASLIVDYMLNAIP